jgi:hypothetical protein
MAKLEPDMVKGEDVHGPIVFTLETENTRQGMKLYRRMTPDEIDAYEKSKTGRTKVRPVAIEGPVPVVGG